MNFYEKFLQLCTEKNVTPSKAAAEMGFSRSVITRWKAGGGATDATIAKAAAFFGVPAADFLNLDKKDVSASTDVQDLPLSNLLYITAKENGLHAAMNLIESQYDSLFEDDVLRQLKEKEERFLATYRAMTPEQKALAEAMMKTILDSRK